MSQALCPDYNGKRPLTSFLVASWFFQCAFFFDNQIKKKWDFFHFPSQLCSWVDLCLLVLPLMTVISECIRLLPCELVPPWHLLLREWCTSAHALNCTIFFDQAAARAENWEGETWEGDNKKEASEGKDGVCHPFTERKHDILVTTTHYPKVFQGFEAWGCLRSALGLFWHPEAHWHDSCVAKASASHILVHVPELAVTKRPMVNHTTNTGPNWFLPQTSMYTWTCQGRWRKAGQGL